MNRQDVMDAFLALLAIDERDRAAALAELAHQNPALGDQCARLLRAHEAATRGEFLGEGAVPLLVDGLRRNPPQIPSPGGASPSGVAIQPKTPSAMPPHPEGLRLVKLLGRGGFGEVWVAENATTGAIRAVKMIPDSVGAELDGLRRLTHAVQHREGLVQIEHVGIAGAWLYAVMPLADPAESSGAIQSLSGYRALTARAFAARRVSMSPGEVASIGEAVAGGLAALHATGLAHGDVKPDNILRFEGQWRLGDYSVVHPVDSGVFVGGTPDFLPPEGGGGVAADQYALAITLFMLAHRRDATEFQAWRDNPPTQADDSRPARGLDAVLRRAGHRNPAARFPSIEDVRLALARVATETDGTVAAGQGGRSRRVGVGVLVVAGIAVVVGIALMLRTTRTPPPLASGAVAQPTPSVPARIDPFVVSFRPRGMTKDYDVLVNLARGFSSEPPLVVADAWEWRALIEARSRVWCYLLYLRPDGSIDLCWPHDAGRDDFPGTPDRAPGAFRYLEYPPDNRPFHVELSEGVGQAGVLVVASNTPLPPYDQWAHRQPIEVAWATEVAPGDLAPGWFSLDCFTLREPPPVRGIGPAPEARSGPHPRVAALHAAVREALSGHGHDSTLDFQGVLFPVQTPVQPPSP